MGVKACGYEVKPSTLAEVKNFIETHHYSKNVNGVKVTQCYSLLDKDRLVGAILFGALSTTAWKKYSHHEKGVLELRRLVCLDECPKNTETWFVSKALKHIKSNYDFSICVSYADPRFDHIGTIYQAGNWNYLGQTNKDTVLVTPNGREYHSRALRTKYKGDYKPFAKRLRQLDEEGLLKRLEVPGKHIYTYTLKGKHTATNTTYPKK